MKKTLMIGNAHIDPVWLWQWREGYQEVKATFRSALDRLEETPEFVFTCACADYYRWVEENDPEMFGEIRARVAEGRWVIVGGMWIQPDMNAPAGESIARQLLYSQRYFKEKLGVTANVGYNVDTFGHNAMLPQLLKKSGIDNYVWMRPDIRENPDIPEGAMRWQAPDGSEVLAYRICGEGGYNRNHDVPGKIAEMLAFSERIGVPAMCFYGVGNHGGGPTIENIREIRAFMAEDADGKSVSFASPVDYFRDLRASGAELPIWKSELQHHASGCYSTCSASKFLHRRTEGALLSMEALGVLSNRLTGHKMREAFVEQAWQNLMFNEFHDIMGGCSLPEAMRDAEMQFAEAVSIAEREENAALQRISWKVDTIKGHPLRVRSKEDFGLWGVNGQGTPVVVFNPHGFEAEGQVLVRRAVRAVRDDSGAAVACQLVRATRTNGEDKWDSVFMAKVPAMGYRLYWVFLEEAEPLPGGLKASETALENDILRAEFDPLTGALTHLVDKRTGRDALSAPARAKLVDIEHCDTWAHMVFKFDKPAGMFSDAKITVMERGPVRASVRVTTAFGLSRLEQIYTLRDGSDQLEISVCIRMQEKHRMLKLCFPADADRSIAEIPYGALERVPNGDEEHCQRWVAVQGGAGGLALINNGRYSYSVQDGELRMTLANTSAYADHYGQTRRDDTCRFMDMEGLTVKLALVPYSGDWSDAKLSRRAAVFNRPLPWVVETYHEGPLAGEYRGIDIDNDFVDIGAFKPAEDGDGYVLRLCETSGRAQRVKADVKLLNRTLELAFGPFEIKTLRLPADPALPAREIPITELEGE